MPCVLFAGTTFLFHNERKRLREDTSLKEDKQMHINIEVWLILRYFSEEGLTGKSNRLNAPKLFVQECFIRKERNRKQERLKIVKTDSLQTLLLTAGNNLCLASGTQFKAVGCWFMLISDHYDSISLLMHQFITFIVLAHRHSQMQRSQKEMARR